MFASVNSRDQPYAMAAIYLPGEGAMKSVCLALQLMKYLHTGAWVFARLSPCMSLVEQFGEKLSVCSCTAL